jgi:hypothetical protein
MMLERASNRDNRLPRSQRRAADASRRENFASLIDRSTKHEHLNCACGASSDR